MFEIRRSKIHGWGLFATVDIPENTQIVEYTGVSMLKKDFIKQYGNDIQHCLWNRQNFPNTRIIVSKECRNPITYCNESKNPNCKIIQKWLIPIRSIIANEELTLLYPKNYPRDYQLQ
jgi:SET domain-containing protein